MLHVFKAQQGGLFGSYREINTERSGSCDQGGNRGQGADVVRLVDHFAGLWLCF